MAAYRRLPNPIVPRPELEGGAAALVGIVQAERSTCSSASSAATARLFR